MCSFWNLIKKMVESEFSLKNFEYAFPLDLNHVVGHLTLTNFYNIKFTANQIESKLRSSFISSLMRPHNNRNELLYLGLRTERMLQTYKQNKQ